MKLSLQRPPGTNPEYNFKNLQPVTGLLPVIKAVESVLNGERLMIAIYGGVGNGKTHLLHAASNWYYEQGIYLRIMLFAEVLAMLRKAINNEEVKGLYDTLLNRFAYESPRLILDDVGASGSDNEFGDRILETIICGRYERRLTTIMTTNRDIKTLPERVLSRLQDKSRCYLVQNTALDYRPLVKAK